MVLRIGILMVVAALGAWAEYPAAKQGGNYMYNFYIPPAPGTTPWAPAWSPDGKWIAVAMQGSIWKVDPKTGAATELTYNRKYHSSPAWSPDGKWIVYTADDDTRAVQLEILNVATGETRALTNDGQIYLDPVFSPDGARLAYVSTKPTGHFNIYMRAIRDGQWAGEEIALTQDRRYERDRLYFSLWDIHTQPDWTPDGKEIVFVSNRGVPLGSGDLWRMPAEAAGMEKAKRIHREQTLYRTRPDVSIDGKRIVYSSTAGAADQFSNLYVVPIDGGAPYKLTFGRFDYFHPRWSPDGEWIACIANEGGLPQLRLLETYGGEQRTVWIRHREWKRPMGKLRVRVADEATGVTMPARILGVASDGKFYPPDDVYSRRGRDGLHFFHTEGSYIADTPPGRMKVEAARGFQYEPATAEVDVKKDAVTDVVLRLKRIDGLPAPRWFSGSTHVHMNYGGNLRNTPANLIRMSRAEAMDIIMDLAANKDNRIMDHQYFAGGGEHPASVGEPNVKLHIGEEYRPPFYGHVFFLGLRSHLISPFTTGYEGTGIESLYPSNTDMFRKAKAQGAVTGYVHAYGGDEDPLAGTLGGGKGFPVDAALGTVECLEWSNCSRASLAVWHRALNNDLRVTPTGGEDSITDLHFSKIIGSVRTYARVGPDFTVESWQDALRRGHTFMSSGPLLEFTVDGRIAGEEIRLAAGGGSVTLKAAVKSMAPLSKVVIHRNGKVFREISLDSGGKAASFEEKVPVKESGWFALYAEGPPSRYIDAEYPQATTNAIRVYVGDGRIRDRESAEYFVQWIGKLRTMAEKWLWWRSQDEKDHVFGQFEAARRVYEGFAREAK